MEIKDNFTLQFSNASSYSSLTQFSCAVKKKAFPPTDNKYPCYNPFDNITS